jgi:TP901 family phage tail tape measure protein
MARSAATQKKADYLINLGFDVDASTSTQKITALFKQIKTLDNAFQMVGQQLSEISENQSVSEYISDAIKKLNELGRTQAITFSDMKNGIIEVNRAFGDFLRARTSVSQNGVENYTIDKSIAGNVVSPFDSMNTAQALAEQNKIYLKEVEGLGDDVQKSILKMGIQDALSQSNTQLAEFLKNNIDHIEDYVSKSTIAYDSDGKAVSSWVDLKVGEFQKLSVSMKYFTQQLETDNGIAESRIGVRTSQKLSTDREGALRSYKKSLEEQYSLEKKINEETSKGNAEQVAAYKQQKTAIDSIVDSRKKAYLEISSDSGQTSGAQSQIDEIEKEIQARRDLDSAIQKDMQTRKSQEETISSIQSTLKEYLTLLSNTQKMESSGSDTFGARLQYNKDRMSELVNELSQYGQGLVSIDSQTGEATLDQSKLTLVLGQNSEAVKKVTNAVKEYNLELKKESSTKRDFSDAEKINIAIEKTRELVNAQKELNDLKNKKASYSEIEEATKRVERLTSEVEQATSATVANGNSVKQTKEYISESNKILEQANRTQSRFNSTASNSSSILSGLSGSFSRVIENVVKYNIAQFGLNEVISKSINVIKELDSAMTNIRLVTGESADSARETINSYAELATQLGATTSQVAEGSIEWLRQGKTVEETTQLLTASTMLSKLGMMDSAEATEKLTAALNGYKLSANDAIGMVDKLVNIDLIAATSSEELATALQYVSSQANAANISFDKLTALIATASETTRLSAESIGNAFKSIIARMQNVKLGKFIDDSGESINDTEKILNSFGIALRDSNKEWRNLEDVIDEVGSKWDSFTSVEKDAIGVAIAGR